MTSRNEVFINDMNCFHTISTTVYAAFAHRFNNLNQRA